jgi:acyl transferase domain-containing protein
VLNAKTNVDGYKDEGILHPSGDMHKVLLEQCYHECGADTNLLEYVEAHGTGTKVCFIQRKHGLFFLYVINHILIN